MSIALGTGLGPYEGTAHIGAGGMEGNDPATLIKQMAQQMDETTRAVRARGAAL